MKTKIIFILLILFLIASCGEESSPLEYPAQINAGSAKVLYDTFLQGKISANIDGNEQYISDIVNADTISIAYYDMNGDGDDELHIIENLYYVFTYRNNELLQWYMGTGYETPLNNGAIIYRRVGAAPEHIDYAYKIPDFYGEIVYEIYFSEYHVDDGVHYFFDDAEVTKEQWDILTKRYLSISDDNVQWKLHNSG